MTMKRFAGFFVYAIGVLSLAWFLPWLYDLSFPAVGAEPFVAYSPVADDFVISYADPQSSIRIEGQDCEYTKEQRDSLLPQIYFTQLAAREKLPDTIAGKAVSLPVLKRTQWVFTSLPKDINKVEADWHFVMESMPKRYELEDPSHVFSFSDGSVRVMAMEGKAIDERRSQRFAKAFADKKFSYPARHLHANITTRKPYDDGYLMVDADGKVYHFKMRAGTPYLALVDMPPANWAFVLENTDKRLLGLAFSEDNRLYAIERDGYRAWPMEVTIDPTKCRVSVMANLFNIVLRSRDDKGVDWWAVDSDTFGLLGHYRYEYPHSTARKVSEWIFPCRLYFTDVDDSYFFPRIDRLSCKALPLGAILAVACIVISHRRREEPMLRVVTSLCALMFGIYFFIVYLFLKN